jgi:hypothetical protein
VRRAESAATRAASIGAAAGRAKALADRRVAGSVIVNEANQRFFEPAAGRHGLLSARWQHGF